MSEQEHATPSRGPKGIILMVVPDAVLNKPGRLTDEEFKLIQGHAVAGAKILGSAVGAVSEPTYLDEARRLAAYHHERWNGAGYPTHIAGEHGDDKGTQTFDVHDE